MGDSALVDPPGFRPGSRGGDGRVLQNGVDTKAMSAVRFSLLACAVTGLGGAMGLALAQDAPQRRAVALGAGLALVNSVAAFASSTFALRRSPRVFVGVVLGGMGVRMAILLGAVVVAVLGAGMPRIPLVVSLLAHFVVLLSLELLLLHRNTSHRTVAS
jgi:hypothetical protein